jgi:hypothetical protein
MVRKLVAIWFAMLFALAFVSVGSAQDIDEESFEDISATAEASEPAVDASDDLVDDVGDDASELQPWEQWEYLVGAFVIPMITGIGIMKKMDVGQKNLVLAGVTLATTAIGLYLQGDLKDVSDWPSTFISLLISAFVSYNTLGRFVKVPQWLESKTGGDPLTTPVLNIRGAKAKA